MTYELIPSGWVNWQFIQDRLKEPEVVEIDDYFSELAEKLALHEQQDSASDTVDSTDSSSNLAMRPYLKVAPQRTLDELSVIELLNELVNKPRLARRQQVELFIEDQVFRGTVEKLEGEYVYLRENFGMTWRRFPIDQIYRVKLIRHLGHQ